MLWIHVMTVLGTFMAIDGLVFDGTPTERLPKITVFPANRTVLFKIGEPARIDCGATGNPTPTCHWLRNGRPFDPSGIDGRVFQEPVTGSLVFNVTSQKDEGVYQCYASNRLGSSVSPKVAFRYPTLYDFYDKDLMRIRTQVGHAVTLPCTPPQSYPFVEVSWMLKDANGDWQPVLLDNRVIMDLYAKLRFTNVQKSDENNGQPYACATTNHVIGKTVIGPPISLTVIGVTPALSPAQEFWSSPSKLLALKGEELKLQYLCSGNPTPTVSWVKEGGALPNKAELRDNGTKLVIPQMDVLDAGGYIASCTNELSNLPRQRSFIVIVESTPTWTQAPKDVDAHPGNDVVIVCEAEGIPEPYVSWYINGVMIDESKLDTSSPISIEPSGTVAYFPNMGLGNSMNVQCNATNKHGYLWGEASIHIIG